MTNIDTSQPFIKYDSKRLQHVCGKFLYYAQAIVCTMIHLLNTVAIQEISYTEKMNKEINHFMNYCASNPNAVKPYRERDMILMIPMIHGDVAYLVKPEAQRQTGGTGGFL